jgi:hypothetical protein
MSAPDPQQRFAAPFVPEPAWMRTEQWERVVVADE